MSWETLKEAALSLYDKLHAVQREYFHLWKNSMVFTWRWWVALSLFVLPWTLWAIVRKRNSTDRLLYAGAIVAILSSFMDSVGVTLHLWSYPTTIFPLMPSYIPFDLSAMPVATMLCLQFFPKLQPALKALLYAATGAFIFEPFCDWIGLAVQQGWHYAFSFIILYAMYFLAYWIANRKNFDPIR